MESFGKLCAWFLLVCYSTLLNGFTVCKLWDWFITKMFNVESISFWLACGFSLFVGYFIMKKSDLESESERSFTDNIISGAIMITVKCVMALSFGFVYSLFV